MQMYNLVLMKYEFVGYIIKLFSTVYKQFIINNVGVQSFCGALAGCVKDDRDAWH